LILLILLIPLAFCCLIAQKWRFKRIKKSKKIKGIKKIMLKDKESVMLTFQKQQ